LTLAPSLDPSLQGRDFVTPKKHLTRILSTACLQVGVQMWINRAEFIHRFAELSTTSVDNSLRLWTGGALKVGGPGLRLWINLWRTGAESVDKHVDKPVENWGMWINRGLSTSRPQECRIYPHILPQPRQRVFGLGKEELGDYPHIHSPYY
jgi:hypothetical protein